MNGLPRSASEAKRLGLDQYYTGPLPCGHDAPRWAVSKRCTVCQPMDRSREYRLRMRAAFDLAYMRTLHTGFLHAAVFRPDGWWAMPVQDDWVITADSIECAPVRLEGDHGDS